MQYTFDYIGDDAVTGFRLDRLEVLNWGTFHENVWSLKLDGRNGLLTGDIGTGKSTLVDALTTLLLPPQRAAYNKAAGAAARERTLRSYVLGYFKTERADYSESSARPVALRGEGSYSVILGVFRNAESNQGVTLAVVFWDGTRPGRQPRRFYVGWEGDGRARSIEGDFGGFGSNPRDLRKRLKRSGGSIWRSYPKYGAWFRRRLGIHNEQALDLFHQTVSMKSVGNLTSFVRMHMLERFDATRRINSLVRHFDDLSRAHGAVLKAKSQIKALKPIVELADRHAQLESEIAALGRCEDAHEPYFAGLREELLAKEIQSVDDQIASLQATYVRLREERKTHQETIESLKSDIETSGGARLNQLDQQISATEVEVHRRRVRAEKYTRLLSHFDESVPADPASFAATRKRLRDRLDESVSVEERCVNEQMKLQVPLNEAEQARDSLKAEIKSLESRRTNIPAEQLRMRERLCRSIGLSGSPFPFAGELIAVREDARDWEGAAERALRGFALSLLVPEGRYAQVAEAAESTDMGDRLAYFRVKAKPKLRPDIRPNSLLRKLSMKSDSRHFEWLTVELARRFDLVCCSDHGRFLKEARAITRAGQVKSGVHHEKDDRHSIGDRTQYVLGWSNEAKIKALREELREHEATIAELIDRETRVKEVGSRQAGIQRRLHQLRAFSSHDEIDWQSAASEVESLKRQRAKLEAASDKLAVLREELTRARRNFDKADGLCGATHRKIGGCENRREALGASQAEARSVLDAADLEVAKESYAQLGSMLEEISGRRGLTLATIETWAKRVFGRIRDLLNSERPKLEKTRRSMTKRMLEFNRTYPLDTRDVDDDPASAPEYRKKLASLENDGLPAFEDRFKRLLNENTIREVASFQSRLERERTLIRDRITRINKSLEGIEYNPGRYIKIEHQYVPDQEVRAFRADLRECLQGTLSGASDELYSEEKFEAVKQIIERFRGREGRTDIDSRWTAKVTDVRNWFGFAASERHREDNSEYEHYSDSSGKSGGQKEKLAYTILAASLMYQFGLESGPNRARSFRFVVIDEAFGRGSDESARFALNLFSRLHLQVLIATPLQKIHVIEPFVQCVGFVDIHNGRHSRIRNLSIEQYNDEKRRAKESALSLGEVPLEGQEFGSVTDPGAVTIA